MLSKVGSSESEDRWVHWSLKEEERNENANRCLAMASSDVGVESDGATRVDDHEEVGLEHSGQSSGEETTNSEGDQSVGKHVGSLSRGVVGVISCVVDEEGCNCDLGTNVAELGDESEDHVVLLVEGTLLDFTTVVVNVVHDQGVVPLSRFGNLGELGESEEHSNCDTSARNSKVHELNVGEVVLVSVAEEELGGNQRSDEGSNTIPGLTELETG